MHAHRRILTVVGILAALAGAATSARACSLSVGLPGTMRVNSLADPTRMASDISGSTPATLTSLLPLLSGIVVEVGVPTVISAPAGYNYGTSTTQVSYSASSVLGVIKNQTYTSSPTTFGTGVLGAVLMTIVMHNRITNSAGFPAGTYGTRTVVTCHP